MAAPPYIGSTIRWALLQNLLLSFLKLKILINTCIFSRYLLIKYANRWRALKLKKFSAHGSHVSPNATTTYSLNCVWHLHPLQTLMPKRSFKRLSVEL